MKNLKKKKLTKIDYTLIVFLLIAPIIAFIKLAGPGLFLTVANRSIPTNSNSFLFESIEENENTEKNILEFFHKWFNALRNRTDVSTFYSDTINYNNKEGVTKKNVNKEINKLFERWAFADISANDILITKQTDSRFKLEFDINVEYSELFQSFNKSKDYSERRQLIFEKRNDSWIIISDRKTDTN